jgi:hypothetical protein
MGTSVLEARTATARAASPSFPVREARPFDKGKDAGKLVGEISQPAPAPRV